MATTTNFVQKSTNGTPVTNIEDSQIFDNGTNVGIGTTSPLQKLVVFETAATAQMTVETGGTSLGARLRLVAKDNVDATSTAQIIAEADAGQRQTNIQFFLTNNGGAQAEKMRLDQTGVIITGGNLTAVDCFATSDARLKKNVKPKPFDKEKVLKLAALVSTFDWKEDDRKDFGLIAQEVEKIYPELVNTAEDGMKSVNYAKISLLVLQMVASLV